MIIRTYQCTACEVYFEVEHESGEEENPDCPACDKILEWRPVSFNIGTTKGKSIDIAQKIIESDFGVTDFRDNTREGEIAAIAPLPTAEERAAKEKLADDIKQFANGAPDQNNPALNAAVRGFFAGGGGIAGAIDVNQTLAASRQGPGAYTRAHNPMTMLHQAGSKGMLPNNMRVIAKA